MDRRYILPLSIFAAGIIIAGSILSAHDVSLNPFERDRGDREISDVRSDEIVLGNPDAPLIFIEYSDTECPFCKEFQETKDRIMSFYGERGEVAWVYRHLPLINEVSFREANAIECVADSAESYKYWNYIDLIYRNKPMLVDEEEQHIETLMKLARDVEIDTDGLRSCIEDERYEERLERHVEEAMGSGARNTPFTALMIRDSLSETQRNRVQEELSIIPTFSAQIGSDGGKILFNGVIPAEHLESIIEAILLPE